MIRGYSVETRLQRGCRYINNGDYNQSIVAKFEYRTYSLWFADRQESEICAALMTPVEWLSFKAIHDAVEVTRKGRQ